MKPKITAEEYNKQLDELAKEAMKCILSGAYSHPGILTLLGDAAKGNELSIADEISERSYVMATAMLKRRYPFTMKEK